MRLYSAVVSLLVSVVLAIVAVGCSDPNYDVGNDFMRDDQESEIYTRLFNGNIDGEVLFSFSEYTDYDFNVANLTYGITGSQYTENFGKRVSGFYSQYTPYYTLDDDGFGSNPILEEVVFYIPAYTYSGDTTIVNRYNVYMVLDDSFLDVLEDEDDYLQISQEEATSLFGDVATDDTKFKKVFSFNFPDQENEIYAATTSITLDIDDPTQVTADGYDLIMRLMLEEVDGYDQIDYEYYDYDNHDQFIEEFKGLYIEVDASSGSDLEYNGTTDSGVTYGHYLSYCGFGFAGYASEADQDQAEEEGDATTVEMVGMTYSFINSYSDYGNNSVNNIIRTETETDPIVTENKILVEALGGKVTEMRLSKRLFDWLDEQMEAANVDEEFNPFIDVFINRATIKAYIPSMTSYDLVTDYTAIEEMTDVLNLMPSRLGMYTTYANWLDEDDVGTMVPVIDYAVVYEYYYSAVSVYDGYINRTLGLYEMNIHQELQQMWGYWQELENKDMTDEEWNALDWNRIYIGASATNVASVQYATVQGANNTADVNDAQIQFDLIYTLRK